MPAFATYARGMLVYYPIEESGRAVPLLERAAAEFARAGDARLAAAALARSGSARLESGLQLRTGSSRTAAEREQERARAALSKAAASQQQLGLRFERALSINDIGMSYQYQGDLEHARASYAAALRDFTQLREPRTSSWCARTWRPRTSRAASSRPRCVPTKRSPAKRARAMPPARWPTSRTTSR